MVAEILDNIPFPPHKRRGAQPKYPWLQLKPGQAFKFADGIGVASAKSMAAQIASGIEMKFAVRQTEDGVFCWRIDGTGWEVPNGNYRQEIAVIEDYATDPKPAIETTVVGVEPRQGIPSWAPPLEKTDSQKKADAINAEREANLRRIAAEEALARRENDDLI